MNNDIVNYKMNDGSVLSFREFQTFVKRKQNEIDQLIVSNFQDEAKLNEMDKTDPAYLKAEEALVENNIRLVKLRCDFEFDVKHTLAFRPVTNAG